MPSRRPGRGPARLGPRRGGLTHLRSHTAPVPRGAGAVVVGGRADRVGWATTCPPGGTPGGAAGDVVFWNDGALFTRSVETPAGAGAPVEPTDATVGTDLLAHALGTDVGARSVLCWRDAHDPRA